MFTFMKVKDIIFIQNSIQEAMDFIASNADGDESGIGETMNTDLLKCVNALQKEKERIYLNSELRKMRKNPAVYHNLNKCIKN